MNEEGMERFFELSKEITKRVKEIKELEDKEDEIYDKEEEGERQSKIERTKEIITGLEEKISVMFKTTLGQMYEGVLVNERISIRKGKIYPFRCRYYESVHNIISIINSNKEEVGKKLGKKNLKIINGFIKFIEENNIADKWKRNRQSSWDEKEETLRFFNVINIFI